VTRLLTVRLARQEDIVVARQRARQVADALGFDPHDQTRIATAVSEIARNAFRYAGGGQVDYGLDLGERLFSVTVSDNGPGIAAIDAVLAGTYRSATGMGVGILGARRVMDRFDIETKKGGGTVVRLSKRVPVRAGAPTRADVAKIGERLAAQRPSSPLDEIEQQNHELLAALEELRVRQDELVRLNEELQDTNRGVVALYAELDEKAEHLRRADETKSRFLSNITHEFQTPLNSILALTRLLLERADGDLASEQERQVELIREATNDLSELVHDLLDIAKVEAGKVTLRPGDFTVAGLFGALRGLMRPLQTQSVVNLVFEAPSQIEPLYTDEAKVSQILRNYISNALKFTEHGDVHVRAFQEGGMAVFQVTDTGIGIRKEDQEKLFQEFGQIPNRLQTRVRGTGLGLSLSKRLAELLGGTVGVESELGVGSTFWLRIPMVAPGCEPPVSAREPSAGTRSGHQPTVLVVDDEQGARYVMRRYLTAAGCRVIEASGGEEGLSRAAADHPDVVVLDLMMPDMLGTEVLARLKRQPATADIPVIIATSQTIDDRERARLETHAAAVLPKSRIGGAAGDDDIRDALHAAGISL
jgi:signal transduction histidine kinase/CheY-like chemotaxis protein